VAGGTQTHEVIHGVCAALRQGLDVVYFLSGCDPSVLLALLAEWVRRYVAVADSLPRPAVTFLHSGVTLVAFVSFCYLLGVLRAVPAVCQLRTAGVGTWPLWSVWHWVTSFWANKKPLRVFPVKALAIVFDDTIIQPLDANKPHEFRTLYPNRRIRRRLRAQSCDRLLQVCFNRINAP
jgi:hypothetical protein